ncbi:MAG TPA: glycerol-3-phosphate 1-O-acyltransferase PlsY [Ginsengibacter sp.]|nr:glycerol-3-phosphate 1-O-acyltransferase PlsY [Chitinophagaceae bacterium]MCZ2395773.1 glycerol-3-phosphate 1-O-acyltransferase PlsY [Chitinophagales bacterium]HRN73618.1 glycerol-3-phosphate 1-O-acyltransferase PlsY [Ginsengibacter sp.]MCW5913473.1 glycerol-3-phosphate 1-O-acyltransferase PlsY [Chitinophagaceae bacterium]HRP18903.1 glycerol-3-phosphate 1-O-acyltransferase PlsY [Ginsengibacter sp.]
MKEAFLVLIAYLIGSIPTALIISKSFFDIDIREYGSGNMGATNTFRVLGPKFGTIVMVGDMLKGVFAVALYNFLPFYLSNELERTNLMIGLGLAAVVGHIYPIWANFKGGKGVATLFGMVLAIQPVVAINCVGVFLLVLFLTRYVSLSSILAGIALPICVLWIYNEKEVFYRVFAVAVAALIILTHQKNIGRLLKGNENRVPILKYRDRRKAKRKEM